MDGWLTVVGDRSIRIHSSAGSGSQSKWQTENAMYTHSPTLEDECCAPPGLRPFVQADAGAARRDFP